MGLDGDLFYACDVEDICVFLISDETYNLLRHGPSEEEEVFSEDGPVLNLDDSNTWLVWQNRAPKVER